MLKNSEHGLKKSQSSEADSKVNDWIDHQA